MKRLRVKSVARWIGVAVLATTGIGLTACHSNHQALSAEWASTVLPAHDTPGYAAVTRGLYLVRAGDCASCHTAKNGEPFAGGHPVLTPFGIIYSTNITPDEDTGIGKWSEADFYRAMHAGLDRQGKHLYPAMPYLWYTRATPDDVRDIKAFLDTLKPVRQANRQPQLPWPMSDRSVMGVWNKMYFNKGTFAPNAQKSAQWNRGAYLVEGLGHCGACHTDPNVAGAPTGKPLHGGLLVGSFAPSLVGGLRDGLGGWTAPDIVEYLKTGSNDKSAPAGAMAEVVANSTQYLSDADLDDIAAYLKDMPGPKSETTHSDLDKNTQSLGAAVYVDNCAACHMDSGQGQAHTFPPLKGSSAVQAAKADTMVRVVLGGAGIPATEPKPTGLKMPAFNEKLDDAQVAAVVSYIRNAWGNHAATVSTGDVAKMRTNLRKKGSE
ncbi:MAG: c-type cytochrome [Rhodanobacter sp.]